MFKLGDKVWVCYDGKAGRRCEGVVVATHRGSAVTVTFELWGEEEPTVVTKKFRVTKRGRKWGGPGKQVAGHVNNHLSEEDKQQYPGPWYRVYATKHVKV